MIMRKRIPANKIKLKEAVDLEEMEEEVKLKKEKRK